MSARTGPVGWPQPRAASESEGAVLVWLDALAGGICTAEAFLSAMQEQFQEEHNKSWEVLSLLDQYYRRGKIKAEIFHRLKHELEGSALSSDEDLTESVRPQAPSVTSVTAPAAASSKTASATSLNKTSPVSPSQASPASPDEVSPTLPNQAPPTLHNPVSPTPPNRAPRTLRNQASPTLPDQAPPAPPSQEQASPTLSNQASAAWRPEVQEVRAVREVAIGDLLRGRYRVRGVLGHGGMGTVFDAIDEYRLDLPTSGQRIAIKVLHTAVTRREELLAELQREFQHLQLLSHPNIVRVHEFDRDGDNAFFTMEPLIGALLSQVLGARNGVALPRPYALAVTRDVGAALAHAHSRGVVHGDINPQNIFVTNDGELRVLDFGASHKLLRGAGWSQRAPVATPGYASCQLLEGQHPDARDDLFAFACVAYLLLSGQHPFPRRTAVEARVQRVRPARPPGLTGQQWRVLREGLRWERDRRPADVQKWLDRFNIAAAAPRLPRLPALMDAPPPRNRRVAKAAAVIAMFALLAAGGFWAVTNYDSLARLVMPAAPVVTDQAAPPSKAESAPALRANPSSAPTTAAPKITAPTASAPTASAPTASSPAANAPAAKAPAANVPAANVPAANVPVASVPGAPPTPAPEPRAAAATRSSATEASARAGNAGPIRLEMAADTVDVKPSDGAALITVRRRGNVHGDASFRWWTESGTATPGRDFAPVIPRVEHIADGSGSVSLIVPVLSTPRGKSRSFYVVIDQTESGGAGLGARTLTMVTIQPTD